MNIIFWKNAALLLPETIELKYVIGGCILLSLPTNWLKDFQAPTQTRLNQLMEPTQTRLNQLNGSHYLTYPQGLSFLSAFGFACVMFICAVVLYELIASPADSSVTHETSNLGGYPIAASIMLAGLTGMGP